MQARYSRRELLRALGAGAVLLASGELWWPGEKLISIPKPTVWTYQDPRAVYSGAVHGGSMFVKMVIHGVNEKGEVVGEEHLIDPSIHGQGVVMKNEFKLVSKIRIIDGDLVGFDADKVIIDEVPEARQG